MPKVSFRTNKRLHHLEINGNDILKVIKDLNPNKGWDTISIRMIKLCGNTLVTPLLIILATALETGIVIDFIPDSDAIIVFDFSRAIHAGYSVYQNQNK